MPPTRRSQGRTRENSIFGPYEQQPAPKGPSAAEAKENRAAAALHLHHASPFHNLEADKNAFEAALQQHQASLAHNSNSAAPNAHYHGPDWSSPHQSPQRQVDDDQLVPMFHETHLQFITTEEQQSPQHQPISHSQHQELNFPFHPPHPLSLISPHPFEHRSHLHISQILMIASLRFYVPRHGDNAPMDDDTISHVVTYLSPPHMKRGSELVDCTMVCEWLLHHQFRSDDEGIQAIWKEMYERRPMWEEWARKGYWKWMEYMRGIWMRCWASGQQDWLKSQLEWTGQETEAEREFALQMFHRFARQAETPGQVGHWR